MGWIDNLKSRQIGTLTCPSRKERRADDGFHIQTTKIVDRNRA
jgi:hypothetical protein